MTNFYGLECTRDHLCSLIRKWHTLIDTFVDCKTSDGFLMRFFIVAFTSMYKTMKNPKKWFFKKATCYANRSQVRQMRAIITKIITKECKASTMKDLVYKVLGNEITEEMAKNANLFSLLKILLLEKSNLSRDQKLILIN